jgi:hypothetical protein
LATSAAEARRFTLSTLAAWGVAGLDDTVSLLVTELVTNGVRHAGTGLELTVSFDGRCLHVGVADGDIRPVSPRTARARTVSQTVGGWGLALVDSLSTSWGTDIDDARGKTVWFEIDVTAQSRRS